MVFLFMNDEKKGLDVSDAEEVENLVVDSVKPEVSKRVSFLEVLSRLSPGKSFRTALDDIQNGRTGALIVFDCLGLRDYCEGGFEVNCEFTSQKMVELAKMDGAIVLSSDLKKIVIANSLLIPDTKIQTNETGTRHKAAERISKQFDTPVVAVSQRRGNISLYYDNKKYVLQNSESLLSRATENLNVLEKQREICDDLITNLNILETTNLVSVGDVCSILQRMEIITRVMSTLKRYIIELGKEGVIIQMRVLELVKGMEKLKEHILIDYTSKPENTQRLISSINFDGLLDLDALAKIIFEANQDKQILPKGYRLLKKLNLTEGEIERLIDYFKDFGNLLNSKDEDIDRILGHKTYDFKKELEHLREQIMMGKKI